MGRTLCSTNPHTTLNTSKGCDHFTYFLPGLPNVPSYPSPKDQTKTDLASLWPRAPAQGSYLHTSNSLDNLAIYSLDNNMDNTPTNNCHHTTDLLPGCPSLLSNSNHGTLQSNLPNSQPNLIHV